VSAQNLRFGSAAARETYAGAAPSGVTIRFQSRALRLALASPIAGTFKLYDRGVRLGGVTATGTLALPLAGAVVGAASLVGTLTLSLPFAGAITAGAVLTGDATFSSGTVTLGDLRFTLTVGPAVTGALGMSPSVSGTLRVTDAVTGAVRLDTPVTLDLGTDPAVTCDVTLN
jgi:hypothetical protein